MPDLPLFSLPQMLLMPYSSWHLRHCLAFLSQDSDHSATRGSLCTSLGHGEGQGQAVQTPWCLRTGHSNGGLCPGLAAPCHWWGKPPDHLQIHVLITPRQRIFNLSGVACSCWVGVTSHGKGRLTSWLPESTHYVGLVAAGRRAQQQVGLLSQVSRQAPGACWEPALSASVPRPEGESH